MLEKILIADDELNIREGLKDALIIENYKIDLAEDGLDALKKIKQHKYDLVLTDVRMPNLTGLDLLEQTKIYSPDTDVILMTAYGTIEDAVCAIKNNAHDYISKPIDIKKLRILIKNTLENKKIIFEKKIKFNTIDKKNNEQEIIGHHPKIKEILSLIKCIAVSDATILIQGESGTGKDLIANNIHYNSKQKDHPFIAINCGAIPENLLESELFGHEKGSFTGADSKHIGKFELANNGTLFLDEISTMNLKSQVNLLRVLEEQKITRLGGNESVKIKVRFISASNVKLDELVAKGEFREDLYYRLNVVPVCLPPLRERQSDIPILIDKFLKFFCDKYNYKLKSFSEEAENNLINYYWPGNIRELKNIIERLVVISPSEIIEVSELPSNILIRNFSNKSASPTNPISTTQEITMKDMEKELIKITLDKFIGHREKTAKALGISVRTLHYKIKRYEIK